MSRYGCRFVFVLIDHDRRAYEVHTPEGDRLGVVYRTERLTGTHGNLYAWQGTLPGRRSRRTPRYPVRWAAAEALAKLVEA